MGDRFFESFHFALFTMQMQFYISIILSVRGGILKAKLVIWLTHLRFQAYRIRSNYRTYPYKRTVKKFRSLQITVSVLFFFTSL